MPRDDNCDDEMMMRGGEGWWWMGVTQQQRARRLVGGAGLDAERCVARNLSNGCPAQRENKTAVSRSSARIEWKSKTMPTMPDQKGKTHGGRMEENFEKKEYYI